MTADIAWQYYTTRPQRQRDQKKCDATLGFIFGMIFGHAPVIFPAVLGRPLNYGSHFCGPVVLLHAPPGVRILVDLAGLAVLRRWGALFNGIALLLFLTVTVFSLRRQAAIAAPVFEKQAHAHR